MNIGREYNGKQSYKYRARGGGKKLTMTNILALETSTDACSAALLVNGAVSQCFEIAPRRHTEIILPMIARLLAGAELAVQNLDAIAFGAGPGSFTGVRIATAITQGIALAHDLPVVPLSCLALLALGGARIHACATVVPILDARKHEVYWAVYRVDQATQLATCITADAIGSPRELTLPSTAHQVVVGTGARAYYTEITGVHTDSAAPACEPLYPCAADALMHAVNALASNTTVTAEMAAPIYLRRAL